MLTLALPKGRILAEALPLLDKAGLAPKSGEAGDATRRIMVESQDAGVRLIVIRAADVQTYVSYGTAQLGLIGLDLLLENPMDGVLHDSDLGIGKCRLVVAAREGLDYTATLAGGKHLTVATKYPRLAQQYFVRIGVQAEIVRLYGAMELAPNVGLSDVIVDLVATGATLAANRLVEVATIMSVSTYLVFNQAAAWHSAEVLAKIADRLAGQVTV